MSGWPPALEINDPRSAAVVLAILGLVFLARVLGQLLVVTRAPRWLPPMTEWQSGVLPYRWLLVVQLVYLGVMTTITLGLLAGVPAIVQRRPAPGAVLVGVGWIYALAMVARYAVRMARHPGARWTGQVIPILAHLVLAAWIIVLGSYLKGP